MPSITITIELGDQFIYDILTNWVEGGYSDWAAFSEVNREVDTKDVISCVVEDAEYHGLTMMGETSEVPDFTHELVDYDTIVTGLTRILSVCDPDDAACEHVGIDSNILDYIHRGVREQDAGDIDAIAADCIVQAGLFSELVYS